LVSVSLPADVVTVRLTVYVPGVSYSCAGLAAVLVTLSPKIQTRLVIPAEPGSDRSVKLTVNGAAPDVTSALNSAVGPVGVGGGQPTRNTHTVNMATRNVLCVNLDVNMSSPLVPVQRELDNCRIS
jgi:hypothetical protein